LLAGGDPLFAVVLSVGRLYQTHFFASIETLRTNMCHTPRPPLAPVEKRERVDQVDRICRPVGLSPPIAIIIGLRALAFATRLALLFARPSASRDN
jgi:hypothetical protein